MFFLICPANVLDQKFHFLLLQTVNKENKIKPLFRHNRVLSNLRLKLVYFCTLSYWNQILSWRLNISYSNLLFPLNLISVFITVVFISHTLLNYKFKKSVKMHQNYGTTKWLSQGPEKLLRCGNNHMEPKSAWVYRLPIPSHKLSRHL